MSGKTDRMGRKRTSILRSKPAKDEQGTQKNFL